MKRLILIRHAKSSWEDAGMNDFDRPLNNRGKEEAPQMAKRLKEKIKDADLFVSSPAKRAFKTAKLFAEEFKVDKKDIQLEDSLYEAAVQDFEKLVSSLEDRNNIVLLFSHNPGIAAFANTLTSVHIDDMPTCSIYAVQADVETWGEFMTAEKKFLFFDYPKNAL